MEIHDQVRPVCDGHDRSVDFKLFWSYRGFAPNMTAVAIPITVTIFTTDLFINLKTDSFSS